MGENLKQCCFCEEDKPGWCNEPTGQAPKRIGFISIQHGSGMSAEGYRPSPVGTGYEYVVPHRTGDLFARTAKQPGKVTKVDKDSISYEYKDGTVEHVQLGRRFGRAAGTTFPHTLVSKLSVGDTFDSGDALAYNQGFFEPDRMNPKKVLWKAGVMCRTAFVESFDTFEDSSAVSQRVAEALGTSLTEEREVIVNFDQHIRDMLKEGDEVTSESILCTIEEATTSEAGMFDDATQETLRLLSADAPRAKKNGVVDKIEIMYQGEVEDMSPSVAALVNGYDRKLAKQRKALGKTPITAQIRGSIRIGGRNLEPDSLVIRFYITGRQKAGVGDKAVFANQMKTILARVMEGTNTTESGEPLDALFGYQSSDNRILTSPQKWGMLNTLLSIGSKRAAHIYRHGKET